MKKILLVLSILSICMAHANNKIVYLIAPPCNGADSFLKMMIARHDCSIVNEPFEKLFSATFKADLSEDAKEKAIKNVLQEVLDPVVKQSKERHVFVKDISYSAAGFLLNDETFIKNPDLHFIFLVRDPHAAIMSYYKRYGEPIPKETFGYRGLSLLFEKAKHHAVNVPWLISAEDLYAAPAVTLKYLCDRIHIPFNESALTWNTQEAVAVTGNTISHMHNRQYTQFNPLKRYAYDQRGVPSFTEITNPLVRTNAQEAYAYNLEFYQQLFADERYLCREALNFSLESDPQQWVNETIGTLSLEQAQVAANVLYYNYLYFKSEQEFFSSLATIHDLTAQLDIFAIKSAPLAYQANGALIEKATELQDIFKNRSDLNCFLQAAANYYSAESNQLLRNALEGIERYADLVVKASCKKDHPELLQLLEKLYELGVAPLEKFKFCNEIVHAVAQGKNPYSDSRDIADNRLNDLNRVFMISEICSELLQSLAQNVSEIKKINGIYAQVRSVIFGAFYRALYQSLTRASGCGIPILFDGVTILPPHARTQFLPPLSNQQR